MTQEEMRARYADLSTVELLQLAQQIKIVRTDFQELLLNELRQRGEIAAVAEAEKILNPPQSDAGQDDQEEIIDAHILERLGAGENKEEIMADLKKDILSASLQQTYWVKSRRATYRAFIKAKFGDDYLKKLTHFVKEYEMDSDKWDQVVKMARRARTVEMIFGILFIISGVVFLGFMQRGSSAMVFGLFARIILGIILLFEAGRHGKHLSAMPQMKKKLIV